VTFTTLPGAVKGTNPAGGFATRRSSMDAAQARRDESALEAAALIPRSAACPMNCLRLNRLVMIGTEYHSQFFCPPVIHIRAEFKARDALGADSVSRLLIAH